MFFSEIFDASSQSRISPDGSRLAIISDDYLSIRLIESLELENVYPLKGRKVHKCIWSLDSAYILVYFKESNCINIWSAIDPEWSTRIQLDQLEVSHIQWCPDSRHIVCISDFSLQICIWSLCDPDQNPKVLAMPPKHLVIPRKPRHNIISSSSSSTSSSWTLSSFITFSPDGYYMAVLSRIDFQDLVVIYSAQGDWNIVNQFPLETSFTTNQDHSMISQACAIEWTGCGKAILVWNDELDYHISCYSPSGLRVYHYSAYERALGIKSVQVNLPLGMVLIGSYDQTLRLINMYTGAIIAELEHDSQIVDQNVIIYKENVSKQDKENIDLADGNNYSNVFSRNAPRSGKQNAQAMMHRKKDKLTESYHFEIENTPYIIPYAVSTEGTNSHGFMNLNKPNPSLGVGLIETSHDGTHAATCNENMSNVVWIWNVRQFCLAAVIHCRKPVQSIAWDPIKTRLAICSDTCMVSLWTEEGMSSLKVPSVGFQAKQIQYGADGTALLVSDIRTNSSCLILD